MRRMRRKGARLCSILLALALMLSLMTTQAAFASGTEGETTVEATPPVEDHEDEPASAKEPADTGSEKTKSADPAEAGENDSAEDAPAASTDVDAAQDEDSTDADPLTETAEPSDSGENDVQAGEDEKTALPTEPTETPKKEVVLEETMEEEPALSAAPARGSRALSLQEAKVGLGVGSTCPYCGERCL